jgi:hypothetical protein
MKFKGDIIITDPCYIMRSEENELTRNDWEACEYGDNMEVLGINNYLTSETEYGDWSCTTINKDTNTSIGNFCADAGLVSVFLLEEVLKYNPDFDYHINNKHTTTLIKDFDGDVEITHRDFKYFDEEENEEYDDREVSVIGKGNINFYTTQTGF